MRIRKALSHTPCADNMAALQDAWSVLKNEPVEKGIFDRFRRTPDKPRDYPKEEEDSYISDVFGPTDTGLTNEQPPEPEMPLEQAQQLMSETPSPQVKNQCENCKALEKQLKREAGTNRALMNQLSSLEFQMKLFKNRKGKRR